MVPEAMDGERFQQEFFLRNVPGTYALLKEKTVGIAGAGGLGSNTAQALVRAGVGRLILADPDRVEVSNLNRQLFFVDQVGMLKVEALAATLKRIDPNRSILVHAERITPSNLGSIFGRADLLVEALDQASEKTMLIEAWRRSMPDRYIVAASGLAGYGNFEGLEIQRKGYLVICGDGQSDMSIGLSAPRVAIVANMQANVAVEILLG